MRTRAHRKLTYCIGIIFVALLLCAFVQISTISLSGLNGVETEISYEGAVLSDDSLLVYVDYSSYLNTNYKSVKNINQKGTQFEIARDIIVATDPAFEHILDLKQSTINGEQYVYEYETSSNVSKVYIQPPVLLIPREIDTVSIPLGDNNATITSQPAAASENSWITVTNTEVNKIKEGLYQVKIRIEGDSELFPRFPMLVMNNIEYGSDLSLYFDENMDLNYGICLFLVAYDDQDALATDLATAELRISNALVKIMVKESELTSSIKEITVTN